MCSEDGRPVTSVCCWWNLAGDLGTEGIDGSTRIVTRYRCHTRIDKTQYAHTHTHTSEPFFFKSLISRAKVLSVRINLISFFLKAVQYLPSSILLRVVSIHFHSFFKDFVLVIKLFCLIHHFVLFIEFFCFVYNIMFFV